MSNDELSNYQINESTSSSDNDCLPEDQHDDNLSRKLHRYTNETVGESIYKILSLYHKHALTKEALNDYVNVLNSFLPQPNNLPKTKYFLSKKIDLILSNSEQVIKKTSIL